MSEGPNSEPACSDEDQDDEELGNDENESFKDTERPKKLLDVANQYWKSGLYIDVTVVVGTQRFPTHRLVLSSLSHYFPPLLKMNENESREVILHSVEPDDFYIILNYAYTGEVNITKENVQSVLIASDYLNIPRVKDVCIKFMTANLDVDNVCNVLMFGIEFPLSELAESSKKFLKEHLDEVSRTHGFSKLDPKILETFFDDNNLILYSGKVGLKSVEREKLILNSVLRYFSNRSAMNPEIMEMIIRTVRLSLIPKEEVQKCLNDFNTLKNNEIIKKYVKFREIVVKSFKEKKQNVPRTTSAHSAAQEIPATWFQLRKLSSFSIPSSSMRYAAENKIALSPNPPDRFLNDCNIEIKCIEIWLRVWDDKKVIGGLSMTYRGAFDDDSNLIYRKGHCQGRRDYHIIELEPGEFIIKVTLRSGWLIDRLGFETNRGRVFGPYGGHNGSGYTENAPQGPLSYLFDINCDSVYTQGSEAIFNLILRWIKFS